MHLHHKTAVKTVTQILELNLALMSLRLIFSSVSGPYKWGVVSETVCDLINKIKMRKEWQLELLFGENQFLVPPPFFLDGSIPIKPGLELIVDIPVNPCRITDIYIDDFILLAVDIEETDNLQRCDRTPLLAFHSCSQPLDENEPIPREMMEARNKLHSEALLNNKKTILGWFIDFWQLRIQLPDNKFKAWTASCPRPLGGPQGGMQGSKRVLS